MKDQRQIKSIKTRFAPSPTGFMHIGNARTAFFNWLYTKHVGGSFYLRIEDTDSERSTKEAENVIIESLRWMGINWDQEVVYQSKNCIRHIEVTKQLIESGKAYYCYLSKEEIEESKKGNLYEKVVSPWRDVSAAPRIPEGANPVVRLKVEQTGVTVVEDAIRGKVEVDNSQLDDMILLRSDGTPTYMLAVVVDDHDMGINYVIRGNDHFTNTFRQIQLIKACNWEIPKYAHLPLIHTSDGTKFSKRSGALSVLYYREAGYLPEAFLNYLLLLGWGHETQDIWSVEEAKKAFDVNDVNKAPARFDQKKLDYLNAHFIKKTNDQNLAELVEAEFEKQNYIKGLSDKKTLLKAIMQLKTRAKTILEMTEMAKIYFEKIDPIDEKSFAILNEKENLKLLPLLTKEISKIDEDLWSRDKVKEVCENLAERLNIKSVILMKILRARVVGTFNSPGIYDVLEVLGRTQTLNRLL